MRFAFAFVVAAASLCAQDRDAHARMVARLAAEADAFDKSAHRVAGIETLKQTIPRGVSIRRSARGTETVLPQRVREIVSEYGFITLDERGGWFKEARMVVTVDGQRWKKGKKDLDSLANLLSASDDKKKRSLLEDFEHFGLEGVVTDLGQLILLFARGLITNYEFNYQATEESEDGPLAVYGYSQLNGSDALTIYEGKQAIRQTLRGKIWVRASDSLPVKISVESDRQVKKSLLRDVSEVTYAMSEFGYLLPKKVVHEQFGDRQLLVLDEFTYSGFKQVIDGVSR